MHTFSRRITRAAGLLAVTLLSALIISGPANAQVVDPYTLEAGSELEALGVTFVLDGDCSPTTDPCGPWKDPSNTFPDVHLRGTSTLTGMLNTAGSELTVHAPLTVILSDPFFGPCELIINNSKALMYDSAPGEYIYSGEVGDYGFGSCPAFSQQVVDSNLGGSPSSAPFTANWKLT